MDDSIDATLRMRLRDVRGLADPAAASAALLKTSEWLKRQGETPARRALVVAAYVDAGKRVAVNGPTAVELQAWATAGPEDRGSNTVEDAAKFERWRARNYPGEP